MYGKLQTKKEVENEEITSVLLVMLMVFAIIGNANAATITSTLGEFSSPYHNPGTYYDQYLVGTFAYDLMGEDIISATISGTWGNSANPTTAANLLLVDSLQVADTADYSPSPYSTYFVNWSYTFTDFSTLLDGTADFFTIQTSQYVVRLGATTLTMETAPVPEPTTMLLLGTGLIGLVGLRRKFKK